MREQERASVMLPFENRHYHYVHSGQIHISVPANNPPASALRAKEGLAHRRIIMDDFHWLFNGAMMDKMLN